MKVLFLSLIDIRTIDAHNLYTDLLRQFIADGNDVFIASPAERRVNMESGIIEKREHSCILKIKVGNIQKTNIIEKGISTVLLEYQFKAAIRKYFSDVKFDLVLYATPPITLVGVIDYVKKRDNAFTYLMLKDIFPQNALDLGMMRTSGVKGLIYYFFKKKEEKLYAVSDKIGCMSQANVGFLLKNNPSITKDKTEICPNCTEVQESEITQKEKEEIRDKYNIPQDKMVLVYGGNLGRPQGIDYLIECLKTQLNNDKLFFLIMGNGTEYGKIESFINETKPANILLKPSIPKEDYDRLVHSCDMGMIFLDHRFTIPNFPSRLLSYMQAKLPVLACTDPNTDVKDVIVNNGFGWWAESNDLDNFVKAIKEIEKETNLKDKGLKGYQFLLKEYTSEKVYRIIKATIEKRQA